MIHNLVVLKSFFFLITGDLPLFMHRKVMETFETSKLPSYIIQILFIGGNPSQHPIYVGLHQTF